MAKKQTMFFAAGDDLRLVLQSLMGKTSFQLVGIDLVGEEPDVRTLEGIGDLSLARYGNQAQEPAYLLVRPGVKVGIRGVEQRDGSARYILDQSSHPESVMLRPGGEFDGCVIAGQVGTISDAPWSVTVYRELARELAKHFQRIKSYRVGKIAAEILDAGGRLTANVNAPVEYDLRRS